MKGEYITQKENLIWEEVQIFFFVKKYFFPKGVTETFDTENNTSLVNLGFRGDATLNNSLYRALANITWFHLEKIVSYTWLCDEIEWWGNWRTLWDNETSLLCHSEGHRWVVICSVKGLIDKSPVLKKCEV